METTVKTRIIKIGNSQGVRIPKMLLDQSGMGEEVELVVQTGQLVIRPPGDRAMTGRHSSWTWRRKVMTACSMPDRRPARQQECERMGMVVRVRGLPGQSDPTVGSDIQKTRPCLIVSPDELNLHIATAIVAPMTTKGRSYPTRVACSFEGKDGQIVLDQLRTVDKTRLVRRLGEIDGKPNMPCGPPWPSSLQSSSGGKDLFFILRPSSFILHPSSFVVSRG